MAFLANIVTQVKHVVKPNCIIWSTYGQCTVDKKISYLPIMLKQSIGNKWSSQQDLYILARQSLYKVRYLFY